MGSVAARESAPPVCAALFSIVTSRGKNRTRALEQVTPGFREGCWVLKCQQTDTSLLSQSTKLFVCNFVFKFLTGARFPDRFLDKDSSEI